MEARQAQQTQTALPPAPAQQPSAEPSAPAPEDPIAADRKRREYESLFASNVVLSRRPEAERPDAGAGAAGSSTGSQRASQDLPSLQEVADAVVRASGRQNFPSQSVTPSSRRRHQLMASTPPRRTLARNGPQNARSPSERLVRSIRSSRER